VRNNYTYIFFVCVILTLFLLTPSDAIVEKSLKKASFIPQWSPQAQFAGYYVALEKGIYKKYGIDLTIISGGPDRHPTDFLKNKKADFATFWLSTAIQRSSGGIKIINIGQIIQKSALMLVAKKASGIKTYTDINNKKVSIWEGDFAIQPHAFFKKYNLNVKIIPQSYSVNLFLRGGVDAVSAMLYNEYHTIINSGLDPDELTTFFYYDYGLNFPEDGIYTLEDTFQKDPEVSCAFVKASIEGWLYAFSHPQEATDIVLKSMTQAKIPANRMHQKWMLEKMKELILPENSQGNIGVLKQSDYELVAQELKKVGLIKAIPLFKDFHRKCNSHVQK